MAGVRSLVGLGLRLSAVSVRTYAKVPVPMSYFGGKKKKKMTVEEKQDEKAESKYQELMSLENKNPQTFLDILTSFEVSNPSRRGHTEFIYAALKVMKEFGVERQLEYYKKLLNIFPKEKMVAKNLLQVEFQHFPLQQQCAVMVLHQMEDNAVMPDEEVCMILMQVFGSRSRPMKKYARMNYWMPKFRYASPWLLPDLIPSDTLEAAKLAIQRITSVDLQTKIQVFQTSEVEDSVDKTWIVSGQSPAQQKLLASHDKTKPLYIDGMFRVWLRKTSIAYFVLRTDAPEKLPRRFMSKEESDDVSNLENPYTGLKETALALPSSVHEQEEATYLACCATGSSSRDSLLSWLRLLHRSNPLLENIPVIFTLKAPSVSVVPMNFSLEETGFEESDKR